MLEAATLLLARQARSAPVLEITSFGILFYDFKRQYF
jgi:hypothetical protein